MTLRVNPIRRIQATRKLDGHIAIDLVGEIEERREHARISGAFNTAENIAYKALRLRSLDSIRKEFDVKEV